MLLADKVLLDVFITMGFVILGGIAYAATGGDDDAS
jgi:hypothetical protein